MINIYICINTETRVSETEREDSTSTRSMSWWQQTGGHETALTACKLPDPLLVSTDNKGPPSHCSSAQSLCWPLPAAGEPGLCGDLLEIQMLTLPSMKKK